MQCNGITKQGRRCLNAATINGFCVRHFHINSEKDNSYCKKCGRKYNE